MDYLLVLFMVNLHNYNLGFVIVRKCTGNLFLCKNVLEGDYMELFDKEIENHNLQDNGEVVNLQMAIGMAVYHPETDKEYMDVFRRADNAMYEDKKQKKNRER